MFGAEVRQDQPLDDARETMLATIDAAAGPRRSPKEEVDRARAALLKNIELTLNNADRVGLSSREWIGAGRLAPVLPATATASRQGHRRGRAAGGRRRT